MKYYTIFLKATLSFAAGASLAGTAFYLFLSCPGYRDENIVMSDTTNWDAPNQNFICENFMPTFSTIFGALFAGVSLRMNCTTNDREDDLDDDHTDYTPL